MSGRYLTRSYSLYPHPHVRDVRTGAETADVRGILNGDLDPFIRARLLGS